MFYFSVIPTSLFTLLAFLVLIFTLQDSDYAQFLLERTTVKGIAISVLLMNLSFYSLIIYSIIYVPPAINLWFGLSVVFVAFLSGLLGVNALGKIDIESYFGSFVWNPGNDPVIAVVSLIIAILFCVWRVERLRREE